MTLRLLDRYWHTVRHLRSAQVLARVDLRVRAALRRLRPAAARRRYARRAVAQGLEAGLDPFGLRGAGLDARRWLTPASLAQLDTEAADAIAGAFTFHGERAAFGRPIDWLAPAQNRLWRYHLQYLDVLPALVVADVPWPQVASLLEEWDARNPLGDPGTGDAWHPYVVSLRLVNSMVALSAAPQNQVWPPRVLASLRTQTMFVARNLEDDVGGNHLLKNLKALAIAGCFWSGDAADGLRTRFGARFTASLASQLRSDGGHYEQSPTYHCQTLTDAIEVALALRLSGRDVPAVLAEVIARMDAFLARICHPDGDIPRFGDSAAGLTPEVSEVRAAAAVALGGPPGPGLCVRHALLAAGLERRPGVPAGAPPAQRLARSTVRGNALAAWDPGASGFVTLDSADGRRFLVADAGPVCPDDLPAHGHSDTFGFELSVDATRLVVDTGVSEYRPGLWRQYERSTRAHSTVVVDGTEQSDCWGSFRVAARAHVAGGRTVSRPGLRGFAATHTGYDRGPSPVRHTRHFFFVDERFWIIVDELTGSGAHTWMTSLHLHPDASAVHCGDVWLVSRREATLAVSRFGVDPPVAVRGALDPPQGWYAPAFGVRLAAPVLVSEGRGDLPAMFGWLLVPHAAPGEAISIAAADPAIVRVEVGGRRYEVSLEETRPDQAGAIRSRR
jgi:uncharacterized heparinase superfamily protein